MTHFREDHAGYTIEGHTHTPYHRVSVFVGREGSLDGDLTGKAIYHMGAVLPAEAPAEAVQDLLGTMVAMVKALIDAKADMSALDLVHNAKVLSFESGVVLPWSLGDL